ncbi:MAG: carboxypeptidase regulatory-like domain-containing protein [Euryarchaeota archaeon]|nr:carboxypeptidase regulatory-like domain-containing protein [Euryarchaeota archaeon]
MRARFIGWLLLGILAAGCLDPAEPVLNTATTPAPAPAQEPKPTDDAGSISVAVVTDDLLPVANAQVVVIEPERAALTDELGHATFNQVPPGERTVVASKPGYRTVPEKGVLVKVEAGSVSEVTFTLMALQVVTANSSFHRIIPMQGFISCGGYVAPVGDLNRCGQGVFVQGQWYLRDPNNNSTHPYAIEVRGVEDIWAELQWQPANDALGKTLRFWNYPKRTCTETGCSYTSPIGGKGGSSPVRWNRLQGADQNITKSLEYAHGKDLKFPATMWVDVWPTSEPVVSGVNVGYSVFYQQRYSMWVSVFYGQPAPADHTAMPK